MAILVVSVCVGSKRNLFLLILQYQVMILFNQLRIGSCQILDWYHYRTLFVTNDQFQTQNQAPWNQETYFSCGDTDSQTGPDVTLATQYNQIIPYQNSLQKRTSLNQGIKFSSGTADIIRLNLSPSMGYEPDLSNQIFT